LVALAFGTLGDNSRWTAGKKYDGKIWREQPEGTVFFISGTAAFVECVMEDNQGHREFVYALDLGNKPTTTLEQRSVSFALRHLDYGGVTSGLWWFGSNIPGMAPPPETPSKLRVGHILSDTEPGRPHSPPNYPEAIYHEITYVGESKILHPGSPFPIKALRTQVLCYSVYASSKWVACCLSTLELSRCLELHEATWAGLEVCLVSAIPLKRLGYTDSAPTRLTHAMAQSIPGHLAPKGPPVTRGKPERKTPRMESYDTGEMDDALGRVKAAKNDDADVSIVEWDARVLAPWSGDDSFEQRLVRIRDKFATDALSVIRSRALAKWRRNLLQSFFHYMRASYPQPWTNKPKDQTLCEEWTRDTDAGKDCLRYAASTSWWDWDRGSRLFFWRWPVEARRWARDGMPVYHQPGSLPNYHRRQPPEMDADVQKKVSSKLNKFRDWGYIGSGSVLSLTPYFTVPKGDGDVRLVFDGTKSKLNEALWAPPFVLPTVVSLLRCVEPGTWMSDVDIREMFYNYILDPAIQGHCGVDLSPYCDGINTWEVWTRCVMGIRSSPHGCTMMEMISDEMARGKPSDPHNPFHFDVVRLNLPGSDTYDPSHPWISNIVRATGQIAANTKTYVDDKRVTGASATQCEAATRRIASLLTYLSEQDACRKRVEASRRAGAWAGSICHTDRGAVTVLVTVDKWTKARDYIQELLGVAATTNVFDHKTLERIRGFLIYVIRSYPAFTPYLKGIHLTLDSWRPGRGWDGWRDPGEWLPDNGEGAPGSPPAQVVGVPRCGVVRLWRRIPLRIR
jgi:hypothetical protein